MKIAFYVYPTAFQSPGGGEILLLKTKEYLEKEGVKVTLFDPWRDKLSSFDILHTFGSVKDCLPMMREAKRAGIKNVLSTICWYSWRSALGVSDKFSGKLTALAHHAAKAIFPRFPSARRKMMEASDLLLPNSESEARQLVRFFGIPRSKIEIIPNGVDASYATSNPQLFVDKFKLNNFVLCVGRIEPRKNQLGMVRALKGLGIPVVFIGDYVPNYKSYYESCRREADSNMHFLGPLPHDSGLLASAYHACNTFLLASWLETPGLAAMEAALAGAKVVLTDQGATREYFKNFAAYVSPWRSDQIQKETQRVFTNGRTQGLKEHIEKNYLWRNAALKTIAAYEKVMGWS